MKALITGITGMDGSYLSELLLEKEYEVHGVIRRSSTPNTWRIDGIIDKLHLHFGDLTDANSIETILQEVKPDEIYNLGAQSQVRVSYDIPVYTADTNALGALRILNAMLRHCPEARYYQASSSEIFGDVLENPQSEKTPFNPQSPYGIAKTFAFYTTRIYRYGYKLFAANGILFNHESPRRGETFITQKVVQGFRKIREKKLEKLSVGNVYSLRDWGYAKDYVDGIYKILHYKKPDDFILATGESHSVQEMITYVAFLNGFNLRWRGGGEDTIAYENKTGRELVVVDPRYYRPLEVGPLLGDSAKARKLLGWKPETNFWDLMKLMVEEDKTYAERRGST